MTSKDIAFEFGWRFGLDTGVAVAKYESAGEIEAFNEGRRLGMLDAECLAEVDYYDEVERGAKVGLEWVRYIAAKPALRAESSCETAILIMLSEAGPKTRDGLNVGVQRMTGASVGAIDRARNNLLMDGRVRSTRIRRVPHYEIARGYAA